MKFATHANIEVHVSLEIFNICTCIGQNFYLCLFSTKIDLQLLQTNLIHQSKEGGFLRQIIKLTKARFCLALHLV